MDRDMIREILETMDQPMYEFFKELETVPKRTLVFSGPFDIPRKADITVTNVTERPRMFSAVTTASHMLDIDGSRAYLKARNSTTIHITLRPNTAHIGTTEYIVISHVCAAAYDGNQFNATYFENCFETRRIALVVEFKV
ncbi:hypothetical protein M514_04953 [Trichuris suis]|uniref:Major sperm protein n=1 Tax=Trichuris suis TaxID=68888 RepID=A0A085MAD0_9BILA|nr:hypothetical protein M513_04953 [Trichuris suis]KFD71201.1 hypothetical protein M514_04953 [Trichuris suis]